MITEQQIPILDALKWKSESFFYEYYSLIRVLGIYALYL